MILSSLNKNYSCVTNPVFILDSGEREGESKEKGWLVH